MKERENNQASAGRLGTLLRRELSRARRAHWRAALGPALAVSLLILFAAALLLQLRAPADAGGGRILATTFWVLAALPLALAFIWPWRRLPGLGELLRETEGRAETKQLIETAADVAAGRLSGKGYSPELMDAILERAVTRAAAGLPEPLQGAWPRRGRRALLVMLPLFLLAALLPSRAGIRPLAFLAAPGDPGHYAERAWLELLPGDSTLLAGSPLNLELIEHDLPWRFAGELVLEIDETGDLFRPVALESRDSLHRHAFEAVHRGFSYRARHGRRRSETYRVEVFHPPLLDSLRITASPPAYTGLPIRRLNGLQSSELRLPAGSQLELRGLASSELDRAWLQVGESDSLELVVEGRSVIGEFRLDGDLRLAMGLRDRRGTVTITPTLLELRALADRAPSVEILAPGPDEDLSRDLLESLELLATDDYGIAEVNLHAVKRGEPDTLSSALPLGELADQPRVSLRHLWNLGELFDLFPGDVVEYWLTTMDHRPGVPGLGRSRIHRLRLPSIAEIYAEIEAEDGGRENLLEEMTEEGERLQEDLRRMEQELRADPELDWEKQEELREAFENMEKLSEQLQELSRSLGERSEALSENEMLRQEMAEKLEAIEELMEELRDTEAGELLRKFQEMVENMDPSTLPEELSELRMDHEEILEQLERTEAMLEQLMRDQKMDALRRQVDEMIERQEELRAETEALQEEQADEAESGESEEQSEAGDEGEESEDGADQQESRDDLAEQQEKLAEEARELEEQVEQTAEELAEDFPEESEKMQQEPEDSAVPPMEDASERMKSGDEEASQDQQKASEKLLKLYWRLSQAQASMSAQTDMAAMEALDGVTRQALELSIREEDQQSEMTRLFRSGRRPERLRESARRQMGLYQSMERVREELMNAARKTFAVSRKAMRASSEALESMQASVAELEAGRQVQGIQQAGRSVEQLNIAVIELLRGVQSQGQGTGSCPNPGQSMQDMLQRQEKLNQETRGQGQQQGPGGLSLEQRAGMARLKAEQGAIREGLQDMMGGDGETLGRLDQIIEEMREIEKDFEAGRISEETLRRQEKVFERLLDAQRSVHRRDFKRERQGESADELTPLWPGIEEGDDPLAKLREEIRRGQEGSAPPEYEELIQEYYRSLLEREGGVNP
jgi:hypothetical protein